MNIHEAKTHLSRCLRRLKKGERIILCRRNVPIAEIVSLPESVHKPRPVGLAVGTFKVPPSFFKALPRDVLAAFEGQK